MSATVKLSTKLPGDPEINGLDHIHPRLIVDDTPILCLAWVVPTKVVEDLATQERIPTVEVRRIEPIGSVDTVPQHIVDLAAELYEKRTGRNPLPIGSLLAPAGEVDELDGRMVRADAAAAEMLVGMSPEERDDAMSDGPGLALVPDPGAEVYVFDGDLDADDE